MSDTSRSRLKVSREGIVLIKSLEGFRPRAVRDADGRWMIGYGHTASAREGLTVGEQDAELLLQYDLLPVVKALNEQIPAPLNQHQFDALASFAVSVGVERFLASDVLQRLNAGHAGQAADALFGWPEPPAPDATLRRRAAERALFVADPAAPISLADLLAAPLPPPWVPATEQRLAETLAEPVVPPPEPGLSPFPAVDQPSALASADASASGPFHPEAWSAEQHAAAASDDAVDGDEPFDHEAPLAVLRHENGPSSTGRFGWGETGAFLIMGLVGLSACAASAASFRKAMTSDSLIGDFTIIGWVLALIGLTCVGVSSWNLYRRWERRD